MAQLLGDDHELGRRGGGAPELDRERQTEQLHAREHALQLGRRSCVVVPRLGDLRRARPRHQVPHRVTEQLLLLGESELHRLSPQRASKLNGRCRAWRTPANSYSDLVAVGHPVVGDAPVQLVDRRTQLGAGEVRAEATVDAGGERDVAVLHTIEIRLERMLERRRIEVGAGPAQVDHLPLLDRHAVDLRVARRRPCPRRRHRALVAHDLLDRAGETLGFGDDARRRSSGAWRTRPRCTTATT